MMAVTTHPGLPLVEGADVHKRPHRTNIILSLLSKQDVDAVMARAIAVDLVKGADLALAGKQIQFCWFPVSGLASVIASDRDGNEVEVGMIGHEGVINSATLTGVHQSAMRILVQIGGAALQVDARALTAIVEASDSFMKIVAAYHQALLVQASYSALAYGRYPLPQRLARWILMCADRVGEEDIDLTHEALAIMLGVRRAGVTVAVNALADAGAIIGRRASITIRNRTALLGIAGAGYGAPEFEYRRLTAANGVQDPDLRPASA